MFVIHSYMRLSEHPVATVRIACSRCACKGQYRLARLADKYGSEVEMTVLLSHLAADCTFRDTRRGSAKFCGAFFPDLSVPQPPERPGRPMRPRIVGGQGSLI